jgi:lipopolysaccharide biosynthesis glycosyltransferase
MSDASAPVRVFIGSGEASLLERKTLIYSLRKNSKRPLEIWVMNGTHNAIERNDAPPFLAPLSLEMKYRNVTEFSLYRYLIPQMCDYQGRAIYLDSDMICLGDIGELFETPMDDVDFRAVKEYGNSMWATSVMLFNCGRCRFELETIFDEIDAGRYSYSDFSRFAGHFLQQRPYAIAELDPVWNEFDRFDSNTKLIHYTDLSRQPWKFPNHPFGELWHQYFKEARDSGLISEEDVKLTLMRAYVRKDILDGNRPMRVGALWHKAAGLLQRLGKRG